MAGDFGVNVSKTSTLVLASDSNRQSVTICNNSSNIIYLTLNGPAVLNTGIRLNPRGDFITLSTQSSIYGISSSTANVTGSWV